MASSGTVTLSTQSVDYGGGRGTATLTNIVGWSVDNNGDISFSSISSSDNVGGTWGICGTASWYGVTMEAQVSYNNGGSWNTIASEFYSAALCPNLTNTITISTSLINDLGTAHLTGNCKLRLLYYANAAPTPSPDLPNAFPDEGYSAEVQVPVNVEVDYRPGAVRVSSAWKSTNRTGGKCHLLKNGSWVEMKTNDGGTGTGNPPSRRTSGAWKNQYKIGTT